MLAPSLSGYSKSEVEAAMSAPQISVTTDELYEALCDKCIRKLDEIMGRKMRLAQKIAKARATKPES